MKKVFWLCSALLVLNACGQSYDVVKNNNSSLLFGNHIEGDLDGGEQPGGPGLPTPTPTPGFSVTPTPSNPPVNPSPSPGNPNPSPSPNNPGPSPSPSPGQSPNPGQSPSPAPSPGNPGGDNPLDLSKCGKNSKKVLICHIPKGNPANAHTICVSKQGALHGHGVPLDGSASPSGDYLGKCTGPAPAGSGHRSRK